MSLAFIAGKYIASGSDVLDPRFIARESFLATCPLQEAGNWTDANGGKHVAYYPYRVLTVTFSTSAMTDAMLDEFRDWFASRFESGTQKLSITAWCADEGAYITQDCDLVDFSPVHDSRINSTDGNVYMSFDIKLRGRGGTV